MITLIRPLINEKSMGLTKSGFFTFEVGKEANKNDIGKIIAAKFGVHVLAVRIINAKGKEKSQPTRRGFYTTAASKKAIVRLKKGEKIALFEVAQQDKETEPASAKASAGREVEVRTAEGETVAKSKEKKSLLRGTKVKVEKVAAEPHPTEHMHTQQPGKTKTKGGR